MIKDKIKKDMNEILHGNLADTARKHFGRISDDRDDREKENALADVYDKLQSELDKTEDTLKRPWSRENTVKPLPYRPTDEPQIEKLPGKVTRENPVTMPYRPRDNYREKRLREIDKEIKEVMHGDTDEWLKKNGLFVSEMPENKREKLLGYMYDRLNEERDEIVKNNSLAYKTKTQPERTSPVKTNTPQINRFSNKTETEPEEMVSFALKPKDNSKLDIDSVNNAIRGSLSYKNLLPSEVQDFISNNEGSIKNDEPVKTSYRNNDKVSEIESDMNDFKSTTDMDYLIDNYAEKYGVDYDGGYVSGKYKEQVVKDILSSMEYAHKIASGLKDTIPRPSSVITSELDIAITNLEQLTPPSEKNMAEMYSREQDVRRALMDSKYIDPFLKKYEKIYGYEYSPDMSPNKKRNLFLNVKVQIENDCNKAHMRAKSTENAIDSIAWINENVYKTYDDANELKKTYETLISKQSDAWFNYMIADTKEGESVVNMWDLAAEKMEGDLFRATNSTKPTDAFSEIATEIVGAVHDIKNKGDISLLGEIVDTGKIANENIRYVGLAYKALIDSGMSKEEASKIARRKGFISLAKDIVKKVALHLFV